MANTTANSTQKECSAGMLPIKDALTLLSGKWKIPIIMSLSFGGKRFKEITKEVVGLSDKVLAKELKELEENYLISRTALDTFPPTVAYEITAHGRTLEKVILELKNWGLQHRKMVTGK
ncbi:winged helix-turn-helix transcriptional regulator [Sphingobacterium sp. Mn56C]|uniref:winged helix-turn-helix transcriptional regulator n=1 Tax=Sphingobacterium sp. Mn56C TaxID=3395261 RepID=UPI003BD8684E